jgi:23S rRNA (cytidine1920-2'-O)/16S rRNA (cytidine1409-2'-O)-methyltransferase
VTGQRADLALVARGLVASRAQAQAAIAAGLVTADGRIIRKPSEAIAATAQVTAVQPHPYVSRGGLKLAAALDHFGLDPAGLACLDVGASTGGFSDVLLKRGASHVTAVDTGRDQFHASLRGDARIDLREATDIRRLDRASLKALPTLAVIDVSFISLRLILPAVAALLADEARIVALIKPQFEVGKARIGKGGIVRDDAARDEAIAAILSALRELGFNVLGLIDSPITGGDGNREHLVAAARGR